jgi:hypothetical protein
MWSQRSQALTVAERDWLAWHHPYDDPSSSLSRRLEVVQRHLAAALDRCEDGPISMLSMCAGQGRDILAVLERHHRAADVTARLVELDERNVVIAAGRAAELDSPHIEVVSGDAGVTDAYAGMVPATVILACGVFGNISDPDIETTVAALPTLCSAWATVIWTRHRRSPDLTPSIRSWFSDAGFEEDAFEALTGTSVGVGVHRLVGQPAAFEPGRRLFEFVGYDTLLGDGG